MWIYTVFNVTLFLVSCIIYELQPSILKRIHGHDAIYFDARGGQPSCHYCRYQNPYESSLGGLLSLYIYIVNTIFLEQVKHVQIV